MATTKRKAADITVIRELDGFSKETVAQLKLAAAGVARTELFEAAGAPIPRGVLLVGAHESDVGLAVRALAGASKLARATCGDAPLPAAVGKRIVHATPRAPAALIALLEEQTPGQTLLCASWPKEEAVPEELQDGFRIVEFGLPDEEGRMRMLKHRAKKMRLAEDVVLSDIAKKMEGMSASKVFEACDAAATRCVREHMDADLDADGLAKVAVSAAHFVL